MKWKIFAIIALCCTLIILDRIIIIRNYRAETAVKLSNVMNASLLDLLQKKVITEDQVPKIEKVFQREIEINFNYMRVEVEDANDRN